MFIDNAYASDSGELLYEDENTLINQDGEIQGIQRNPSDGCAPIFIIQYPQPPENTDNMVNSGQSFTVDGNICPDWTFSASPKEGGDDGEMVVTIDGPLPPPPAPEVSSGPLDYVSTFSLIGLIAIGTAILIAILKRKNIFIRHHNNL